MPVQLRIDVCHFLRVLFKKIRKDDLKIRCLDLFPMKRRPVLPEIDELRLSGNRRKQKNDKKK